jgi:hypothetical protein
MTYELLVDVVSPLSRTNEKGDGTPGPSLCIGQHK